MLEHWLLWQAADFCVAHRLRTPIGKPLDTFMCIEAAIKQIAADKRIEVSPKCGGELTENKVKILELPERSGFVMSIISINVK